MFDGAAFRVTIGIAVLGAAGWGVRRAYAGDDVKQVLVNVQRGVVDTLNRLPRYVCTQTISRTRYEPDNPRYAPNGEPRARRCGEIAAEAHAPWWRRTLVSTDRLRLDVAVSHISAGQATEMYSWAGDDQFLHGDLFDFVRDGAVSTGSFSALLSAIFGSDAALFSYDGDQTVGGKLLSRFGFRVPVERSRYMYVVRSGSDLAVPMGYEGTFLIDPGNNDLLQIVVRTNQLPPESGACELTQTLNYSRVTLHGTEFLLPAEARAALIHSDGTQAENSIFYSACHEYESDSSVSFETPEPSVETRVRPPEARPLNPPPGLPFKLALTQRIDSTTAAAGDVITARLKSAIRDRSSKVWVPEGADVRVRLVSVKHYYGHPRPPELKGRPFEASRQYPSLVIRVNLETVEFGGVSYQLPARQDSDYGHYEKRGTLTPRTQIGTLEDPDADISQGMFPFWSTGPQYVVPSGLESNWVTTEPD